MVYRCAVQTYHKLYVLFVEHPRMVLTGKQATSTYQYKDEPSITKLSVANRLNSKTVG